MAEPHMYVHRLTGPDGNTSVAHALALLRPHLPVALPLYRRLQFGRFFPATVLITNLPDLASPSASTLAVPWILAFVDRTCRPETELWLFSSWEATQPSNNSSTGPTGPTRQMGEGIPPSEVKSSTLTAGTTESTPPSALSTNPSIPIPAPLLAEQVALLRALAREIRAQPVPESLHAEIPEFGTSTISDDSAIDESKDSANLSRAAYGGHAADPRVVLGGAVHTATVPALRASGLVTERFDVGLLAYRTYVFDVDALQRGRGEGVERVEGKRGGTREEGRAGGGRNGGDDDDDDDGTSDLPAGLRWGTLAGPAHFGLVRSRTQIPRRDRTLASLPNVGVFEAGSAATTETQPVAWAFVGLDASLTSLHVEPEWRGRGLAKTVTRRLFRREMSRFWQDGLPRWAHGYVYGENEASCRVCESLGGRADWEVVWVRLDLGLLDT